MCTTLYKHIEYVRDIWGMYIVSIQLPVNDEKTRNGACRQPLCTRGAHEQSACRPPFWSSIEHQIMTPHDSKVWKVLFHSEVLLSSFWDFSPGFHVETSFGQSGDVSGNRIRPGIFRYCWGQKYPKSTAFRLLIAQAYIRCWSVLLSSKSYNFVLNTLIHKR